MRETVADEVNARGARLLSAGAVRFSVWAPRARSVKVRLASPERELELAPAGEGLFTGTTSASAGEEYALRLDDGPDRPDPVSRFQPRGVHGPSAIVDPSSFRWSDGGWPGVSMPDLVLYELHVGTFTPEGTFDAVAKRLPYLRDLGVTALELMPVAEFPGGRNWGYDGVHPWAPQSTYGGPDGLRRLVDAAHGAGLGVILDVVYNHLGPEGNYLDEFGPYFTDRYETPWGRAINFDGPDSDEVRRYFVENAVSWIRDYRLDGLRLDAVHGIFDFGARHILEEIAEAAHAAAARAGRRAVVIAESDLNDPRLVRPVERGGYALDGQWSDDFHHAVHAALTGEREGYYVDFGAPELIAKAFADRFVLGGCRSSYRRRRHGAPAADVPRDRFVVFIQNHDQVGNRARGERLATLLDPAGLRLGAALCLLSPYVPLLFMGEEWGETNPYLYFVSHGDRELVAAVREGRRREFEAFGWDGEIPDPQATETFEASRLDWQRAKTEAHAAVAALYRELIRLRREEPALRPGDASVQASTPSPGVIHLRLGHPRGDLLAIFNLTSASIQPDLPDGGRWLALLSTEEPRFGGSQSLPPAGAHGLRVPATAAILFRASDG